MNIPENNQKIILILRSMLENYGFEFENFVSVMKKHKLILSGSFLLQAILNEYYDHSDINLYVLSFKNKQIEADIIHMIDPDVDNVEFFNISKDTNIKQNKLLVNNCKVERIDFVKLGITSKSVLSFQDELYVDDKIINHKKPMILES